MRGAFAVAVSAVAGCGFQQGATTPTGDGGGDDGGDANTMIIDARPVDASFDARVCPAAPANCVMFTCASSTSCYYVCGNTAGKQSWTGGRDACVSSQRGCLATINDQAEQDCITSATNPVFAGMNFVWFGLHQTATNDEPAGNWNWQCPPSTYVQPGWGSGEPNDSGGNEDCAALTGGGGWFDGGCGTSARYLCELP